MFCMQIIRDRRLPYVLLTRTPDAIKLHTTPVGEPQFRREVKRERERERHVDDYSYAIVSCVLVREL